MLPFLAFKHLHLASHLGMLDEPREGCDVGAEPKDGCMVDLSRRWKDPWSTCLNRRCSPSECRLTNTNLVLDPRQAPEYSNLPMFLQISLESFIFDALGYKS